MMLMSLQSCRVSNLLILTCVASCDEFCILEKLSVACFKIWALIHALATRGRKKGWEKLHCIPRTYPKSQGGANLSQESRGSLCISFAFLAFGGCGLLYQVGLTDFGNRLDRFGGTGLTYFGNRPDPFVPSVGTLFRGSMHMCRGLLFSLEVCALCLSIVLSRMSRVVALA
jgi:hypothetical protein